MLEFVVSAMRLLAEIPGVAPPTEEGRPLKWLDVEVVESRYHALSTEDRDRIGGQWRILQRLLRQQRAIQVAADQLIHTLAQQLILPVAFDAATDELLRGCIVHRELGTLTGELSAEDMRALLFMARWMHKRANRAAQICPETMGKE